MVNVTKTYLPPQEEYNEILSRAWKKEWITNRGELVCELEDKLKSKLDINNIIVTSNGTLPIQIAIKALGLTGEIITTPFSYIATSSSIIWEGCTPVFVDINKEYLTIDEDQIENAITSNTSAILVTHVFGNPCDVDVIQKIANKHNLKIIYDAAHCFGVKYKGESIFNYGDVSTCSFHATKVFHTGEGGALICNDKSLYNKLFYAHNFGHKGHDEFWGLGINAKMSELQAAMGLAVLPKMNDIIEDRRRTVSYYKENIINVLFQKIRAKTDWNYSYCPIILKNEAETIEVIKALNEKDIYPRRYFHPSLNTIPFINSDTECPISEDISKRILCLPLYYGLKETDIELICNIISDITIK